MPRSTVDIIIDAEWKGNNAATRAEQSIRDIGDAADKAERQSSGFFQGLIQGAGQQAFGLITDKIGDATRAVIEFGQESIAVAGTVGETTSLLQTSLGPAYEDFVDDVDAVSDATGRSALKFQEAVSPILAMQRSMGFAQEEAGNLSVAFGQAALDLESFFNTSTGFEDIQGALAGSSETLQKYGIDVRETTLQNRALELGLIDTRAEYDRQVRSLVILEEIQRQAADAMGDAARTADSAVNKQRALEDAIYDLQAAIGEQLLPVTSELTELKYEFLKEVTPELVDSVGEIAGQMADILAIYRDAKSEFEGGFLDQLLGFSQGETDSFLQKALTVANPSQFLGRQIQKLLGIDPESLGEQADQIRKIDEMFGATAGAVAEYADALDDAAVAQDGLTTVTGDYVTEADREAAALRLLKTAREQAFSADDIRNRSWRIGFEDFAEGIRAADFFAKVIAEGNKGLQVTPDLAKAAGESLKEELAAAASELGTVFSSELDKVLGQEDFDFSLTVDGSANTLTEDLFELGKQANLSAGELALLAAATGNYTDEQIEAAFKVAVMQQAISDLAAEVREGAITFDEAELELIGLRDELSNSTLDAGRLKDETRLLNDELDRIEGDRSATITIATNGLDALERATGLIASIQASNGIVLSQTVGGPGLTSGVVPGGGSSPAPAVSAPSTRAPARAQGFSQ